MSRLAIAAAWLAALMMSCHPIGTTAPSPEPTSPRQVREQAVVGVVEVVDVAPEPPSGSVWDDLAQCESGGDWSYNGPSGFDGGLQFHPQTWVGYGGREFAEYAYDATRTQQIVVAERVLEGQGWGAWPSCSRKLGLR